MYTDVWFWKDIRSLSDLQWIANTVQGVATYLKLYFFFVDTTSSLLVSECSDVDIWNEKGMIDHVSMLNYCACTCLVHGFNLNISTCKVSGTSALKTVHLPFSTWSRRLYFSLLNFLFLWFCALSLVIDMTELGLIACCFLYLTRVSELIFEQIIVP